jgi:phosphatidylserine synthase 2
MAQTKRRSSSRTRSSSRPAELIAATEVIESAPHITETKDDAAQTLAQQDSDTLSFFYTPHTITALVLMLIAFLYNAVYTTASTDFATNSKMGLVAMMVTFSLIGLLMFPDGNFIRPHPAAWRIVLSSSAIYQLILVWILFQNVDDVRQLLRYVDPSLGLQLPERSYADNCELSYANVMEQMDEFVVAHVLGWVAKGIMLRDYWILWILSIMFEVLEYSLQHQLPNFAECWWDHWILDVSICNLLGLWLGMQYNYYMSLKEYSWRGFKQIPSVGGKVKRAVQQFTPYSWTK